MSKLVPIEDALAMVPDGAAITAGGFAHSDQPLAFVRAMIRAGRQDLTLIGIAECWVAELLAASGRLRRAYMSNFMVEGFGRCRRFSRGVETGAIAVEDHSHFGIICRLAAAGLGLPFMPVRSMSGTDILDRSGFEPAEAKWRRIASPFGGGDVIAVSPLRPDVAILHVARADRFGNVQIGGTTAVLEEQARAARRVIVTADEIVDTDEIRRHPERTLLPGLLVDAVVHLPFGAHPTGLYDYYDHDFPHLAEYHESAARDDDLARYLDRYVFAPSDHWAYLDTITPSRLLRLAVDPALGWRMEDANG